MVVDGSKQIVVQRKSGHVTLGDVARACGYSISTVSIVLSEAPLSQNIAVSTRERVQSAARRLGYHPDAYARSLRSRRTQTIGVLAYDLSDPFCVPIVRGIQAALQPAGFLPLLVDAQTRRALFDDYVTLILERRAEAVIVIASWVFEETNLLADVRKNRVPMVIVSRDMTEQGISSVLVDNEAGGALALHHLSALGHRRIAVIRGPEKVFDSEPRWRGIQSAADETGIRLDPNLIFQLPGQAGPDSGFEEGLAFSRKMLASGHPFTAVVAFDDLTALGVVRGLIEAGLRVPEDCSVLGFDDVFPAAVATPGLTTIRQPLREMGMRAAEWMLGAIEARKLNETPLLSKVKPELVVRMSSAPPKNSKVRGKTVNDS